MSAPLTLTKDEIAELTGLRQPAAQARALERLKIPHARRPADGSIIVGREAAARALCFPTQRDPEALAANDDDLINWSVRQ